MNRIETESGRIWLYDPNDRIGGGGFGEVFKGFEEEDKTPCAIKLLTLNKNLNPRLLKREIEISKRLQDNPCAYLIRTLDYAEIDDQLVLIMELAKRTLSEAIGSKMVESEATLAIKDIIAGVHELHNLGIMHRDLKPSNILQCDDKWKLADFGIAHDTEVGTQTYTFAGAGTGPYLAPELFERRSPTVKSDLYALGCIAYELLTGTPPFPGPEWEDYRHQHAESMPPELPITINPLLRRLVLQLLKKKNEERPQDAREVAERLSRVATPYSPAQKKLLASAANITEVELTNEANSAAKEAVFEHRRKTANQTLTDLNAICDDALDGFQSALPDVTLVKKDKQNFIFEGQQARLEIRSWMGSIIKPTKGPLINAGQVTGRNHLSEFWQKREERPMPDYPVRLANIVAEVEEGQLLWRVYRFECVDMDTSHIYRFGPKERKHGLQCVPFLKYYNTMNRDTFCGASLTKYLLTPD